jgi:hypothetical protein
VAVEPTIEAIAAALRDAAAGVSDARRRLAGASVAWSTSWGESFPDELLDRVIELSGARQAR